MAKVIVIYGSEEQYAVQFELTPDGSLVGSYGDAEFKVDVNGFGVKHQYEIYAPTIKAGVQPPASIAEVIRQYQASAAQECHDCSETEGLTTDNDGYLRCPNCLSESAYAVATRGEGGDRA